MAANLNLDLDVDESIKIGDNIEIRYIRRLGRKIRLKIIADRSYIISRTKLEIIRKPHLKSEISE